MKRDTLILSGILACLLALAIGCASGDHKPTAQKLDQLAAVWITYDASPKGPADESAAITAAYAALGVDIEGLSGVAPTASGMELAKAIVAKHPEFAPMETVFAKLYTLAIYGQQ